MKFVDGDALLDPGHIVTLLLTTLSGGEFVDWSKGFFVGRVDLLQKVLSMSSDAFSMA